VVTAPLALTSFLFVPQYCTPPPLFDLDARFRVGIEDFLWAGAAGGIASVVGEIVLKERLAARRNVRCIRRCRRERRLRICSGLSFGPWRRVPPHGNSGL